MTNNLRILQVSPHEFGGGAEKSAISLFKQYRDLGYKSWLALGVKKSNDPDIIEIPNSKKIKYSENFLSFVDKLILKEDDQIRFKKRIKYILRVLNSQVELKRAIHYRLGWEDFNYPGTWQLLDLPPQKPNLIHLHNLHGNYFDLMYLPALSHKVPVILNLRDMWAFTGHCALPIDCERWKKGCGHCPDLKIYPAIARDATKHNLQKKKDIYSRSKLYITTPTKWLMDQIFSSRAFSAMEYRVISNAINVNLFRPGNKKLAREALDLPQEAQIVLFLAHNEFKDFKTLHESLKYIQKSQVPLIFLCIGINGKTELIGKGELIFTGWVSDEDKMVQYYQAADVYMHAAHHEVFGKSIIEAMACSIPVVATSVDGIPEVIDHGVTGFLVPPKNPIEMARMVNCLLENDGLREEVGMKSTNFARNKFSLDRQANDFLKWYDEILTREIHDD